jgi:hypothetical protein
LGVKIQNGTTEYDDCGFLVVGGERDWEFPPQPFDSKQEYSYTLFRFEPNMNRYEPL